MINLFSQRLKYKKQNQVLLARKRLLGLRTTLQTFALQLPYLLCLRHYFGLVLCQIALFSAEGIYFYLTWEPSFPAAPSLPFIITIILS